MNCALCYTRSARWTPSYERMNPRALAYSQVIQKFPKVTQPIVKSHISDKKLEMCCKSTEVRQEYRTFTRHASHAHGRWRQIQDNVGRDQDDPMEPHDK